MTKRFCDRCEEELGPPDDIPFVRVDTEHNIKVSLIITNLENLAIAEVCNNCKVAIINQPIDAEPETIAAISNAPTLESPAKPFTSAKADFKQEDVGPSVPVFELCLPPKTTITSVPEKKRGRGRPKKQSGIVKDEAA